MKTHQEMSIMAAIQQAAEMELLRLSEAVPMPLPAPYEQTEEQQHEAERRRRREEEMPTIIQLTAQRAAERVVTEWFERGWLETVKLPHVEVEVTHDASGYCVIFTLKAGDGNLMSRRVLQALERRDGRAWNLPGWVPVVGVDDVIEHGEVDDAEG